MKEGPRDRPSLSDGLHEGDLEGGLLYWGLEKMCYVRLRNWASASLGPRFWGTWRGALFLGPMRKGKKNSYL